MRHTVSRRDALLGLASTSLVLASPHVAAAAEPVNVGGLPPLTGGGSPFGPSIAAGLKRVVATVNKEGGVLNGRPVNLFIEDEETNPEPAARAAAKLINVNKVTAILGGFSSSVSLALMPMCQEQNIIQMFTSASSDIPLRDTKRLTFNFQALSPVWGRALGNLGKARGFKSYGLMALNNDFTKSMLDGFIDAVGKDAIKNEPFYYNSGQPSYRAEVERLISTKPEAVFIPSYFLDFVAVYKDLYKAGYTGKVISTSASVTPQFKKAVGAAADGILHGFPVPPLKSPAYKQFLVEAGLKDTGEVQEPFGTAARDQMSVYLLGIEKAKSTDSLAVAKAIHEITGGSGKELVYNVSDGLKALRAGKEITFSGASSSLRFDDRNQLLGRDFALWEVKDGKDALLALLNEKA
jgi:branched-chain amino acid transport system substrate-binding protein